MEAIGWESRGVVTTILIVDDEEPVRDFLGMVLEDAGYHILRASNGREALGLIERYLPALVLADVMMPVLGGVELIRRLRSGLDTVHIPVILMSSAGEWVAEGAGADAFLAMPFDLEDVEALVRCWLPRRMTQDAPLRSSP
jgi:two-component system, OmpR family, phosphate regulon response regulator PhoB